MPELKDGKISQNQFADFSQDFVLDLIAVFSLMEGDTVELLKKSESEHWSPDTLISEIEKLI